MTTMSLRHTSARGGRRVLEVENLSVSFGPVQALKGVSISVGEHEFVSVLGPNGAGKTTLLRGISRSVPWTSGDVRIDGTSIKSMPPERIARLGVAHVPEGHRVFGQMTVQENLAIGSMRRSTAAATFDGVYAAFPKLVELRNQRAVMLSGGEQQMLAIGRALMSKPRLLMLDEPSMGLAPVIIEQIFAYITTLSSSSNLSVLLIEQRAAEALESSQRAYVLEQGKVTIEGPSAELLQSTQIQNAYLGVDAKG